uniref:nidogen-like n=1 Tax=Styela clava TaxID=7725 RepID=UPI00193A6353|nr:nidogen-like [Styela clava]
MKTVAVLLAVFAVGQSAVFNDFYPFDRENDHRVPKGDNTSSPQFELDLPIIFYDSVYNGIKVNADGFVTLGVVEHEIEEHLLEPVLVPFGFNLNNTDASEIYYQEHKDEATLSRATNDIQKAFVETAEAFVAKSAFIVTWVRLESPEHPGLTFTFQCVVVSNHLSSFAIFLYADDELAAGQSEEIRNQLIAKAGFSDKGGDQLESMTATELLEGGNAWSTGEWIFQIGGVLLSLEEEEEIPSHHLKAEPIHHRRESGFEVPEVNFNEDYGSDQQDCDSLECDPEFSTCTAFADGYCCQCSEGSFGNGYACIREDDDVRYNGQVDGYSIVMSDPWSNETAKGVDMHSYVVTKDGRAFSVMNGEISAKLYRALQPMAIFGTTLGWLFAQAEAPAINGFQYSGGKIVSETYIRYTTGQYEFRIRQEYDQVINDPEGGEGKVLNGRMTFSGRLPPVEEGENINVDDYTQIYKRTGADSIRSRDTRRYIVGDTEHIFTVDQSIRFEGCEASFEEVPADLAVDVSEVFLKFFPDENNLRFAVNSRIRPAEEVGVRPVEPSIIPDTPVPDTPVPDTPEPTPSETPVEKPEEPEIPEVVVTPATQTVCERQLQQVQQFQRENPGIVDEIFFPTCTDVGTFAPRQCLTYNSICWCVDEDTGEEIHGTRTEPLVGYQLDCSDVRAPPPAQTPCQEDRSNAETDRIVAGSEANSIFMPRCMESGAYEPVQQLPDGSFMCVDFDGEEISRSTEMPNCLTPCQLAAYVAESSNIFLETNEFVVRCKADGDYNPEQCVETYCYCVDENGLEITNSRVETTFGEDVDLDCGKFNSKPVTSTVTTPTTTTGPIVGQEVRRLLFAQTMGINVIDLPVTRENSVSRRLFARSDQITIALGYDCSSKKYYWTDVSKRRIYSSVLDGDGSRAQFLGDRLRSPEGISVDFLSGNVYWTDSEYDRIEVASADGSNRMTVVSGDIVNPRGIAVDPIRGRMYWTDWNRKAPKVWVANMDGSDRRVLLSEGLGLPNDITIDFYRQRVCFVDAGTFKVECMSLNGEGRETIYQMKQVPRPHPFGLAVDGDVLYYSSWGGSKVVHAVNWRTGDSIAIAGPRGAHGQMYGVEIAHSQCPRGYNYCSSNNGGCSHLCLPTPTGRECVCPPGAQDCQ